MPAEGEFGSGSWPYVLLGMYEGWAQSHGYEIETAAGPETGVTVRGGNLAGILVGETGERSNRSRDVLRGDIDAFLLAYLSRRLPHRAAAG